ncbi:hypothetical membrane protein [Gemmatimonas aurantiaca T-27]|uniref:Hypothetical membrane protein n=1 Tax=Gemmatimonas aurantiaca (strain DSM 14586 / JCM 11422 / NBRC 100505 / T-27) TaxID=379066 RepID=C1A403_GEMAT|nr:hypothetical protein [Gemmatimonas aurantiaca]BAH38828.1 hypothetical membrane protein [Gemmatimonas aurantiaca T-27]
MSVLPDLHDDPSLRRVLFTAAILLLVVPAVQVGIQVWPLQLSNIQWRFTAANVLSGGMLLPSFLGMVLLLSLSRRLEQKGVQRTVGVLAIIFVLGLGASLGLFVLDALQLKTIVSTQMEAAFKNTAVRVGAVSSMFFVAFALVAWAAFSAPKSAKQAARKADQKGGEDRVGLIIGQE